MLALLGQLRNLKSSRQFRLALLVSFDSPRLRVRAWLVLKVCRVLTLLWGYGAKLRPVVQAVNSFTGSWEAGLSTREADSSVVAAGTLSSIIDPDHNSLGSVLSVVPR